jgi:siroheme synthase
VVCDELIGQDVLEHCRPECEIIVMGKRGGSDKATKQTDINATIVAYCQEGKTVVRVKGGDPLLFGRMADEVRVARQHQ